MTNGKPGDNPLTDLVVHGKHPFPEDIEAMLLEIHRLGREQGRWPLGENWPYLAREFDWERGRGLRAARRDLKHLLELIASGRGDEILVDPLTRKPLSGG